MQVTEDGRHKYGAVDCGVSSSGNEEVLGMSGAQAEIFMSWPPSRGPCGDGSGSMERAGSRPTALAREEKQSESRVVGERERGQ